MDEDVLDNEGEDQESIVDVMRDYLDEETSSSSDNKDIFDEYTGDSNEAVGKPNRKKFVWATHIKIIDEKSPTCYQCTICNSYFSHHNTARNHEFCDSGKKPYKCKLCDNRFVKMCDRDNHYRTHTGERPFECSLCHKTFYLKHKLSRHIRSHTGIKGDFKCSICQRSFICKEALRKHEVSKHTSKKAIKCKTCKKSFETNGQLCQHKCSRKNSKKKLICEICGKTFSKNWNLTVHQRIHKGQRPYECNVCLKSFRLRQHMERHSAKHQPEADFECTLCNQTFGRKDNMIRHLKLTHPDHHLGADLGEVMKRAEKVKSDKLKQYAVKRQSTARPMETSPVPTIITVDNLPNIRFAKMPPGHSRSTENMSTMDSGSKDVRCIKTADSRVSGDPSKSVSGVKSGGSKSTVYASRTVKSVVLTAAIHSGGNQIVRRTTTRVSQQSSVICPTKLTPNTNKIDPRGSQPSCTAPDTSKNEIQVIESTNRSQESTVELQYNCSDVPESQKRYLPVSVLCFKSSSELRTAIPKNMTLSFLSNN